MYNLAIIGAGPAGYTCAIRAAQLGKSVALIERDVVGGICINWGCTPSKAMITSAKYARHARLSHEFGVILDGISVDFRKVSERRDQVIRESREEVRKLLDRWGVTLIAGEAQVLDPHTIQIGNKGIKAENIVYATGSEPILPPFADPSDPSIISSNRLVTIRELPKELTIIGGGIIAFEIATIFCHLGTKVRIVELSCDCLTCLDTDIGGVILREMEKIGVQIMTNHKVVSLKTGILTLENQLTKETLVLDSPMNLIAIGRKPVIFEEELKRLGIEHTYRGIGVNEYMQTNIPNIYAVGDSTGISILAHVAIQQAIIAAEHMDWKSSSFAKATADGLNSQKEDIPEPRKMKYDVIPAVIYTIPEGATVGLVPHNPPDNIRTVRYPFTANLRSHIEDTTEGFVKLWIDKNTNKLVGAQVVHEYAGEIIQAYANMIELKLDLSTTANIIHAHPTFNEIVRNSLEHALDRAVEYY